MCSVKTFEELTASYIPAYFNCSNDDNEYDSRSPKKGPEPESVTVGTIGNDIYAFVALERISGIMVYKIDTEAETASYVNYINTRDFSENPEDVNEENPGYYMTGDVAPGGMYLINTSDTCVLLAAFEVSGTVSAYAVGETVAADVTEPAEAPESAEPSVETEVRNSNISMMWIAAATVIAVVLIIVFVRKRK